MNTSPCSTKEAATSTKETVLLLEYVFYLWALIVWGWVKHNAGRQPHKNVPITPEMQHWCNSLLSLSKSSSWREWGSKTSKTVFALRSSHPKCFQPFSVLGHRVEGCLEGLIPGGPSPFQVMEQESPTWSLACLIAQAGSLHNVHYHHEIMLCSSPDRFHTKSGPFYILHRSTDSSGDIPGTRHQIQNGISAELMHLSKYLYYTLKITKFALPGTLNIFLVYSLSLLPTGAFNVAKPIITSLHHCFSWYSSIKTQFTCKADARNPYNWGLSILKDFYI